MREHPGPEAVAWRPALLAIALAGVLAVAASSSLVVAREQGHAAVTSPSVTATPTGSPRPTSSRATASTASPGVGMPSTAPAATAPPWMPFIAAPAPASSPAPTPPAKAKPSAVAHPTPTAPVAASPASAAARSEAPGAVGVATRQPAGPTVAPSGAAEAAIPASDAVGDVARVLAWGLIAVSFGALLLGMLAVHYAFAARRSVLLVGRDSDRRVTRTAIDRRPGHEVEHAPAVSARTWTQATSDAPGEGVMDLAGAVRAAQQAVAALPGRGTSHPATTLLIGVCSPGRIDLAYCGDGSIVAYLPNADGTPYHVNQVLVPQADAGGALWSALGGRETAPSLVTLEHGDEPVVVALASDGVAEETVGSARPIAAALLALLQGPLEAGDRPEALATSIADPRLRDDNRSIAVLVNAAAADDWRRRSEADTGHADGPLALGALERGPKFSQEDAIETCLVGDRALAVVADGVGSTVNADRASHAAVEAVRRWFLEAVGSGPAS